MAWEKMSPEEQQTHPLYGKRCALNWFATGMSLLAALSVLATIGHTQDFERYVPGLGLLILAYDLLPAAFVILMLYLFRRYGKSKRSAVTIAAMLALLPFVKALSTALTAPVFGENAGLIIDIGVKDVVASLFICAILLIIYLVYGFFSSTFNVQYLSRKRV